MTHKGKLTIGQYTQERGSGMSSDVKVRLERAWSTPRSAVALANDLGLTEAQVLSCVYSNPKRFISKDGMIHRI